MTLPSPLPSRIIVIAKVALTPELCKEDDQPDKRYRPQISLSYLKCPADRKLNQQHQRQRKQGVDRGSDQCLSTGFEILFHRLLQMRSRESGR